MKILILDDDPVITDLLADVLQQEGYKVMASNSPKDVLFLAKQFVPDLLLLDIMMPEVDGYDVCEYFRRDPELKFTRIVILTARDSRESRVRCYKSGADVILAKPFEMDELREVIGNQIRTRWMYQQLFEDLRNQSPLDQAVNCYGRRYMERRIEEELKRVDRYGHPLSLLLLGIDNYKNITIRYGFQFASEVLKDVAHSICEDLRESDLVGRYNDDSFLILLPETPRDGARTVSQRLEDIITSLVFLKKKRLTLRATIATLVVEKGMKLEECFQTLEKMLAEAHSPKVEKRGESAKPPES